MDLSTIDDYMSSLNENKKSYVSEFITFMNNEFPQITPRISFAMPMWWAGSKMYEGYVAISPANKHYSIHFYDDSYLSDLKKALPDCSFGKRCINIKYGDEHSIAIVKQSVKSYFSRIL